jgi:hypothetical protein
LLGDIAMRDERRDPAGAEANYRAALKLCVELGMKPLSAHCQMGLGSLYATVGSCERAAAELAAASEQFRAMKMHLWQKRAEALLRSLSA